MLPDFRTGNCVNVNNCPVLFEIYQRSQQRQHSFYPNYDQMVLSLSSCGYYDGQLIVCCQAPTIQTAPPPATFKPSVPQSNDLFPNPEESECGLDVSER
jgi:Regulatory CLIP domain of proteinases